MPESKSVFAYQIRSVMCVPLCAIDGEPLGALELVAQEGGKRFSSDDLELLLGVANQAAIALENARRHEELIRIEQVELDLEIAGQVQRSILPEKPPQLPGYEFFAYYNSALQVGGDYYDFIPLPAQRLAVTLGDVAGKGMPAALLMTKLCSDARYCFLAESDPAAALGRLNELLHPHTNRTDRFVTFAASVLDPLHHAVTLVNAGQLVPLLYRGSAGTLAAAVPYDVGGRPLGLEKARVYNSCHLELQPGDCLLFFTDGVTDAINVCNQRFGLEGIHKAVAGAGPCTARKLGKRVIQAVEQHAAGCSQHDDITLVCFGRTA